MCHRGQSRRFLSVLQPSKSRGAWTTELSCPMSHVMLSLNQSFHIPHIYFFDKKLKRHNMYEYKILHDMHWKSKNNWINIQQNPSTSVARETKVAVKEKAVKCEKITSEQSCNRRILPLQGRCCNTCPSNMSLFTLSFVPSTIRLKGTPPKKGMFSFQHYPSYPSSPHPPKLSIFLRGGVKNKILHEWQNNVQWRLKG